MMIEMHNIYPCLVTNSVFIVKSTFVLSNQYCNELGAMAPDWHAVQGVHIDIHWNEAHSSIALYRLQWAW